MTTPDNGTITHFDATQRRLEKMRQMAAGAPKSGNGHHAPVANGTPGTNGGNGSAHAPVRNGDAVAHAVAAAAPRSTMPPARTVSPAPVAAPLSPTPAVAERASVAPAAKSQANNAAPGLNPVELEKFLINFVVEQTGYPPEVVELDVDLEADLGIDSIKKAQLFGELAEYFDVQPNENMTLDDFPTLRHVMNFLAAAPMKSAAPEAVAAPMPSAPIAATTASQAPAAVAPAAQPSAAAASPSLDPAELEKFMINFVVEQTGYPPEVVELDADLEADLGIDSIKKAQLFGELAEYFDVQPNENMTLDDFPTLRHVVNFLAAAPMKGDLPAAVAAAVAPTMSSQAQASSLAPESSVAPVAVTPTVKPQAAVASPNLDPAELEKFMINFVVEQTGYPPEVVELDADLEADLGIDSIKKAQLFGELAEYFDVQPNENMTLDDFPTLRHVVNFLAAAPMKSDLPSAVATAEPTTVAATEVAPAAAQLAPAATSQAAATSPRLDPVELEKFLINFVVEQTGYPPEVVELDADLEADLGIDSIKKAQLFGELAEYFDVKPDENLTLDDFPTLRHVMDFLAGSGLKKNLTPNDIEPSQSVSAAVPSPPVAPVSPTLMPQVAPRSPAESAAAPSVVAGLARGRQQRSSIRSLLRRLADQAGDSPIVDEPTAQFSADELDELRGISEGAGVSPSSVLAYGRAVLSLVPSPELSTATSGPATRQSSPVASEPIEVGPKYDLPSEDYQRDDTHRFYLRELELPFEPAAAAMPAWHGAALIVGDHPLGDALRKQLESAGVPVRQLPISDDLDTTIAAFDRIWAEQPTPHVFIVTGREAAADPGDEAAWRRRWYRVALLPFFLCQRWVQRAGEAKLLDRCSLIAATSLNGTLGFSGEISSPECGALTGLMKAIYIEVAIMREQRSMRAKAVDAPADEPVESLAANICRELGSKEVDYEVAFIGGKRYVQCAYPDKAPVAEFADVRPGGTWVITGGARGITAECALELGRRFGLKLHLIGTTPLREIDPSWRNLSQDGMKSLKAAVMREARAAGRSMEAEWSRVQRDIEIDRSLRAFSDAHVKTVYHACDVTDAGALAAVLDEIRRVSGPIEGIVHGAGIERSAGYERKSRASVLATLGSKVDGALNLMRLTESDPVKWFVGFGSISGRLGSNGQTDYCLASDALCKLMTWYRAPRPGVRAVGFHWHAWDEVGMAARPESASAMRLADGPTNMPKREGINHLLREIYAGGPEGEVLITSWEYHGRFYGTEYHPRPDGTVPKPGSINLNSTVAQASPVQAWNAWPFAPQVSRHELKMVAAPLPPDSPARPAWQGSACILGHNASALALREALQAAGVRVHLLPDSDDPTETSAAME
ncbi:MAG: phosphopantetheine-binding protein [Pirellulales bacterium]